jgi:hypothetical protein
MVVNNVHERLLPAAADEVAALMASLSSHEDRLWPRQWWPAMRFDRALGVGAVGGHGPIRYSVVQYVPGESVVFRFSAPRGFDGTHAYYLAAQDEAHTLLWHVLAMRTSGPALLAWPLVFRPLHDALIEDSLDVAEAAMTGQSLGARRWSAWVRLLRAMLRRRR